MKKHQITQEDYQQFDLYAYTIQKKQGDVQNIINMLCDIHRKELNAIHKMYTELISDLKHQLARTEHKSKALSIAIGRHNQKMLGNK